MSTKRSLRASVRTAGAVTAAGLAMLLGTGVAAAHVTAQPGTATKGGYSKITFKVPNERPTAGTVKLQVDLPADHPVASVSTKPVPGWKAEVTKAKLDKPIKTGESEVTEAVRTITWTADPGTRIEPGQFQEFDVSAGPLPDNTDQLVIPATQTYDNGEVVRWDAPPPAMGAPEPEHPAPLVKLVAKAEATASGGHDHASGGSDMSTSEHHAEDTAARWLGGAGLVVGALGLGFGIGALLRGRRPSSTGTGSSSESGGRQE